MSVTFSSSSFEAGLSRCAASLLRYAEKGLEDAASRLKEMSVSRTPVDTGELRSRAFVSPVSAEGDALSVVVGYASESPAYAVIVHERTDVQHNVGQAKFLESSLHEISGQFVSLVGKHLDGAGK